MKIIRLSFLLLTALAVPAAAQAASLREPPPPPDPAFDHTITLSASIGYGSQSTRVRLDASDGSLGTPLDAERDLGLASGELTGNFELILRPRPRHRIRAGFNYLQTDRRAAVALEEDIRFGDQVYFAGETVDSKLRLRSWWMSYGFSLLRLPNAELGLSVGVNNLDLYAQAGVSSRGVRETEERNVPAPQAGLDATFRFSAHWYGEARYQYVEFKDQERRGKLTQIDAAVIWQFDPNIGVGLGYSRFKIDADLRNTGDSGLFRYKVESPQLFLRASF